MSDLPLGELDVERHSFASIVRGHLARRAFNCMEVRQ